MSARLVYVVGPSGSGKDSLLGWLAQQLGPDSGVAFAQRTITRAVQAGGEQHESIDTAGFIQLREAGAFGMAWEANGLCYGVRGSALPPRADATQVIVNGSRVYLDEATRRFPGLKVVQVTASIATLRLRLLARGRESAEMVEARVRRALDAHLPPRPDMIEIHNDHTLAQAGEALVRALGLNAGT